MAVRGLFSWPDYSKCHECFVCFLKPKMFEAKTNSFYVEEFPSNAIWKLSRKVGWYKSLIAPSNVSFSCCSIAKSIRIWPSGFSLINPFEALLALWKAEEREMLNSKKPFSPRLVCDGRNGRYFLPNFGQCDRVNLLIGKASVSWIKLPGNEVRSPRAENHVVIQRRQVVWVLLREQSVSTRSSIVSINAQSTKYDIMWSIFLCSRQPCFSRETWKRSQRSYHCAMCLSL